MKNNNTLEIAFETVMEEHLHNKGFVHIDKEGYDKERSIFPGVVLDFIRTTQQREWQKLETLLGADTGKQVLGDLCKWMDTHGSLATLRHGFKCYGRTLQMAFFKAPHTMNPELERQYLENKPGLTRQLSYSQNNRNTIDITLSVNGIPVATAELKNPMSGQDTRHAQKQYKEDRDPHEIIFEFKRRTLVHFAVDTEQVYMTTRLAGNATHFLPLNKGFEGGAGNPPDAEGRSYRTAYLWEEILERDSFLELLARFMHLQVEEKLSDEGRKIKKETLVFPRYHQLQAVRKLVKAVQQEGAGNNYLIEHSAGSGKTNTIAWLAHRLASLHHDDNEKVFGSVIVITDRVVLDKQLQDTIYQFEHKRGVVQKIEENSRQLALALEARVPIIITTQQKFPFVSEQLLQLAEERGKAGTGILPTQKFAVIIDEAHSSQGGESATSLKEVLGGERLVEEARKKAEEDGEADMKALYRSMAKRARQANISFFAFTATPKHDTLAIFSSNGRPFHTYTMRQAIEENFILDVLKNYTSYATYYKLVKASGADPNVERKNAAKALAKLLKHHPHNIARKTEVMVEHFYTTTRHKIGGHAKAMVVTGSRLEAVKLKLSFDKYIKSKRYPLKSLVAFSGIVNDDTVKNISYTEEGMNKGIKEKELPGKFATPTYHILLVAEKYQTGFDQPLLHTMYIDKRLDGISAVQTLSRLNRIHPLKEDTFVLDFVNDREDIRQAFKVYYEGAEMGQEADPGQLYRLQAELDLPGIYRKEDLNRFCTVYFKPSQKQRASDHEAMNAALDPASSRFSVWLRDNEEEAELWRGKLNAFKTLYAFLSQVIPYQDSDLEKHFIFFRHLSAKLPGKKASTGYNFDDSVRLAYYRLQKISEGSIDLGRGNGGNKLDSPANAGTNILHEDPVPLSRLVDVINERFGTEFNQADQYFLDQVVETAIAEVKLVNAAKANPEDKFVLVFKNMLESLFVERIDQNEDFFSRFMNDVRFQDFLTTMLSSQAYRKIKNQG